MSKPTLLIQHAPKAPCLQSAKSSKATSGIIIALALAAITSVSARADDEAGKIYFNLQNGISFVDSGRAELRPDGGSTRLNYDSGYIGGLGVGYHVTNRLAVEGEIFYRTNDFSGLNIAGTGLEPTGSLASLSGFVNAVWYADYLSDRFTPYVGAGIGYIEEIDADLNLQTGAGGNTATEISGDGFAWQLKAGIDAKLSDNWSIDLGARYMDAGSVTMAGDPGRFAVDYSTWATTVGLRFRF